MTPRTAARPFATALFDVVRSTGTVDRARADLEALVELVAGHEELGRVIESPAVSGATKQSLMTAILDAAGMSSTEVRRLVLHLAAQDQLALLPEIARAFADRIVRSSDVLPAEVVTAAPLADDSRAALERALGQATGSTVTLSERVDPAIVGGVVAKVGSVVFDGSVTRQIERLRQKLRDHA